MKAARISAPKQFEISEIDMPEVQDGQCLIRLESWSVCGSDIRHGYGPIYPEEDYPMRHGAPCHECAGTVVESRSDRFREGQRVIVLPGRDGPSETLAATGPWWSNRSRKGKFMCYNTLGIFLPNSLVRKSLG